MSYIAPSLTRQSKWYSIALPACTAAGSAIALAAAYASSGTTLRRLIPPCPFHAVTGLWCPGCGATRATHALLHGDVSAAFGYNAMYVLFLPFLVAAIVTRVHNRLMPTGARWQLPSLSTPLRVAVLVAVIGFFIGRNLPLEQLQWMAP
jgi:hypothetical protein